MRQLINVAVMPLPQNQPWAPDWTNVPDHAVPRLLAEAREHLQGILAVADSSAQRSVALCGIFAAGAFALFTVAATVFTGAHQNLAMVCASAITGLLFIIASAFCLAAATPSDFYVSGYAPRDLISYAPDTLWMKISTIVDFQRRIDANSAALAKSARLISWAIRFALSGIATGTVISLATIFASLHLVTIDAGPAPAMAMVAIMALILMMILGAEMSRG